MEIELRTKFYRVENDSHIKKMDVDMIRTEVSESGTKVLYRDFYTREFYTEDEVIWDYDEALRVSSERQRGVKHVDCD